MSTSALFGLFSRKSRGDKKRSTPQDSNDDKRSEYVSQNSISYSPTLMFDLQENHQELFDLMEAGENALHNRNGPALRRSLQQLKDAFTAHLLQQNIRLYSYLGHMYCHNHERSKLIRNFRIEMSQVSKVMFAVLDRYTQHNARFDKLFSDHFSSARAALENRIKSEEKLLYPLYLHPKELRRQNQSA